MAQNLPGTISIKYVNIIRFDAHDIKINFLLISMFLLAFYSRSYNSTAHLESSALELATMKKLTISTNRALKVPA